jgi:hypothetical protein
MATKGKCSMIGHSFTVVARLKDGRRETVAGPMALKAAADEAFALAEELSLPGTVSAIREVAIFEGDELQLSIAIEPGVPLTGLE